MIIFLLRNNIAIYSSYIVRARWRWYQLFITGRRMLLDIHDRRNINGQIPTDGRLPKDLIIVVREI